MASGQIDFVNTQKTFLRESLNLSTIDDQIRAGFIAGYLRSGMVADIIVVFNP